MGISFTFFLTPSIGSAETILFNYEANLASSEGPQLGEYLTELSAFQTISGTFGYDTTTGSNLTVGVPSFAFLDISPTGFASVDQAPLNTPDFRDFTIVSSPDLVSSAGETAFDNNSFGDPSRPSITSPFDAIEVEAYFAETASSGATEFVLAIFELLDTSATAFPIDQIKRPTQLNLADYDLATVTFFHSDMRNHSNRLGIVSYDITSLSRSAPDLAPVPLPAAGWLLLASIGCLFVRRKRTSPA